MCSIVFITLRDGSSPGLEGRAGDAHPRADADDELDEAHEPLPVDDRRQRLVSIFDRDLIFWPTVSRSWSPRTARPKTSAGSCSMIVAGDI